MPAAVWKFVVTDLSLTPIGELSDLFEVDLNRRLNGDDSLSFRIRSNNVFFSTLASTEAYVKVYRNNALQFFGEVYSATLTGDELKSGLAVNCLAESYKLSVMTRTSTTNNDAAARAAYTYDFTGQPDRLKMFYTAMYNAQYFAPGVSTTPKTLNTPGLYVPFSIRGTTAYPGTPAEQTPRTVADWLNFTAAGADGFQWQWTPLEPTVVYVRNATPSATTNVYDTGAHLATASGAVAKFVYFYRFDALNTTLVNRPEAIFEYGMGRNTLQGYTLVTSKEFLATSVNTLRTDTLATENTTAPSFSTTKWGLREAVLSIDPAQAGYSAQLGAQMLALRKNPRRRIEIQPQKYIGASTDPPVFETDFLLGNTVTVRIALPNGSLVVNGLVRVYAINFTLDSMLSETVKLTIEEQ